MEFLAFDWSLGSVQCEINQWLLKFPLYLDNCGSAENTRIFVKGGDICWWVPSNLLKTPKSI
jgi:hypothetical protein